MVDLKHYFKYLHALCIMLRITVNRIIIYATDNEIPNIISLLMSPLLGHRPSLWITHKANRPQPTTRTQCGLVGAISG
jgi:hypothetical protein